MRLVIIGTGYAGLVTAGCFADAGHEVLCADAEPAIAFDRDAIPQFEPGLADLIAKGRRSRKLQFVTDLAQALDGADIVFIAVDTPSRRGDGHADLTLVWEAAEEIAKAISGPLIVAIQSTVPVGTGDDVEQMIREARPDAAFTVIANPDFLREGAAIADFRQPDRIVIGTGDAQARDIMRALYASVYSPMPPLLVMGRRTAELTKYAANAFLATKITFINEIADLCEKAGANVDDVARGIGLDHRIGADYLQAGPGFGGSSIPKDIRALVHTSYELGAPFEIVETVARVNDERRQLMAERVIEACGGSVQDKTIAVLGLAFKPDTDDMQNAPSVPLIQKLQQSGAKIRVFDPAAMTLAADVLHDVDYAQDAYDCAQDADAIVLMTSWPLFRALDPVRLKACCHAPPVMIDLCNLFNPVAMTKHGFRYTSIGRPSGAGTDR